MKREVLAQRKHLSAKLQDYKMIISIPPISKPSEDAQEAEKPDDPVSEHVINKSYDFNMVPSGGVQLPDDQYLIDPDYWFLGIADFEDLIKTKK